MTDSALDPRPTASILLVDDHPANLIALEAVLDSLGQRIVCATTGEEALARMREEEFAVVLLDVMMPGIDGLGTADLLRAREGGNEVPIIFMTAGDIPALEGYAHGAADILRKPIDRDVVRAKVSIFVELFRARAQIRRQSARLAGQERTAKARIAALLNASLDAVVGMDHHGRITDFNRAAELMFGQTRKSVLGQAMADVLIPERLRERHRQGLARYLETGETRVLDKRIEVVSLRADGTEFPIELAISRVVADGAPTFIAYLRDLTEHKRIERTRAFLAQASDAFASSIDYEATLQTIVRLAVPHFADWCSVELTSDEPGVTTCVAVAHVDPAKRAAAEALRRDYSADAERLAGVPRVLTTGKSELYADIPGSELGDFARDAEHLELILQLGVRSAMIVPIVARARRLGAITLVATERGRKYDRADLSAAEDLARRAGVAFENARLYRETQLAEERNRFLAEATEALASSLDLATTLERVARLAVPRIADSAAVYQLEDDGAIRLTVYVAASAAHEALGRELDTLLPLRIDQQHRLLPRVLQTGRAEVLGEVPDAMRETWKPTSRADELLAQLQIKSYMVVPLVIQGQPIGALALTTSGSGRRLTGEDLTLAEELARRASLAIDNARLYREAQDASRLKDEFLATVSHELRTPLTAILGWTHLLRAGRPAHVERAIETIERNAQIQARIVDDVLDVSRIITGKLKLELSSVNLAEILQAAIDTVRPAADAKQIVLRADVDPSIGESVGDAARLQQVIWNLLSNAIKFTPAGGQVHIRLERVEANLTLRVSDTGKGIGVEFLPHVFERFRQADSAPTRAHGGLGLGLAIVRHLVELHGGRVAAKSGGDGLGATFTVTLPIRSLEAQAAPRPSRPPPPPGAEAPLGLEGLRVLVVEDEADARDLITNILEREGAQVTAASSVQHARDVLTRWTPDVLVSDLGMPGEDGFALIRHVRGLAAESGLALLPAIALTAYAQIEDKNRAMAAGFQLHLAKPVEPRVLVRSIAHLAQGSAETAAAPVRG